MPIKILNHLQKLVEEPSTQAVQKLLCLIEKEYFDILFLTAITYLNENQASDALQDTFLKIAEKFKVIHKAIEAKKNTGIEESELCNFFREYLVKLLRNVIIDNYLRKRKHLETIDEDSSNELLVEGHLNKEEIWETVGTLQINYQRIINLKFKSGWSINRIGEELSISPKVVRRMLKESLILLKERMAA